MPYGIQPNQRQMRLGEYAFGIRHDLSGVNLRGFPIHRVSPVPYED